MLAIKRVAPHTLLIFVDEARGDMKCHTIESRKMLENQGKELPFSHHIKSEHHAQHSRSPMIYAQRYHLGVARIFYWGGASHKSNALT